MPIIQSAKKRVRVAKRATIRNSKTKRSLKSALKAFEAAAKDGKKTADALSKAQSELDKAVKKGVIHKNKAARKKKQLAAKMKAPGITKTVSNKKAVSKKAGAIKK